MKFLLGFALCLLPLLSFSQEKCATVTYNEQLKRLIGRHSEADFEAWITKKQQARSEKHQQLRTYSGQQQARFTIPVVVHVIHKGEALGQGSNIPTEQILSQLQTLNDDFGARNASQINSLPADFKALAADTEIEFVLAKQDPEGLETDGIIRVFSEEPSWSQEEDLRLKSLSHWPSSKYLNLYVANLAGNLIGWAQFPQSDVLEGLDFGDIAEETDGVVVDYEYMGTGFNATASSTGRTATHEIGHYFGLRHIWGDGGCQQDDYVTDTPADDGEHQGCPTNTPLSCNGSPSMYQNYMDYTADQCMALFTFGQKERMHIVLESSPRRKELNTSIGKQSPTIAANDAGLRDLSLNLSQACFNTYTPTVDVRNYGNTTVTSVTISLLVDGQPLSTTTIATNLGYLEAERVQLEDFQLSASGIRQVSVVITQTNNQSDGKAQNNTTSLEVLAPLKTTLPVAHDFEEGIYPFFSVNPDASYGWRLLEVPDGVTQDNTAAFLNFYDYPALGQKDILVSPILDLRESPKVLVNFRVAYARYDNASRDGLQVYVTSDCQAKLETADLVFEAYGEDLATSPITNSSFRPTNSSQWENILLDLSDYAGMENIQLLFVGVNDYGNNLYLDDLQIFNTLTSPLSVALTNIVQPSTIVGATTTPVSVELLNYGTETIESLTFRITLDGKVIHNQLEKKNLLLKPGETRSLPITTLSRLDTGNHTLHIMVNRPNGIRNEETANSALSKNFHVNLQQSNYPLREIFADSTFREFTWSTSSPSITTTGWELVNAIGPYDKAAEDNHAAKAVYSGNIRSKDKWLASPIFDFTYQQQAGMHFWHYAGGDGQVSLSVIGSLDGGLTWPLVLWEKNSEELKPSNRMSPLEPGAMNNWKKEFISLQPLLGGEKVRIAFVAKGQGSSSIFVDEIEFYQSSLPPDRPVLERNGVLVYPNPSKGEVNIAFNMKEGRGEDVTVELFNSNGSFISKREFLHTLNQIYTMEFPSLPAGMYYLRISSNSIKTTRKLVLVR